MDEPDVNAEMTREKYPNLSCFRDTDLKAVLKQVLCKAPSAHMLMGWQVTTINHKLIHDRNPTSSWKIYRQGVRRIPTPPPFFSFFFSFQIQSKIFIFDFGNERFSRFDK